MRRAGIKERIYNQYRLLKEGVEVVTEIKLGTDKQTGAKDHRVMMSEPMFVERSKVIKWRSKGY